MANCPRCGHGDPLACEFNPAGCSRRQRIRDEDARDAELASRRPRPVASRERTAVERRRSSDQNRIDVHQTVLNVTGRRLWAKLHRWAMAWDGDREAAQRWLADFANQLPRAGCGCREGWEKAIKEEPPPLDRPHDMMGWSVRVHDAINRKLGKPEIGEAEARRIWG